MKLEGAFTALATPFRNGEIDEEALRAAVERQIRARIDGLVPCGSTGEAATLRPDEYLRTIRVVVEAAKGRVPVVAGCTHNATWRGTDQARDVARLGVDALLIAAPYYNKPTADGLVLHTKAMARSAGVPIMLYNIPARTGLNILPPVVERLVKEVPSIAAIKEASGSIAQIGEVLERVGDRVSVLSGDDPMTLPTVALGGRGVVSVVSNLFPKEVRALVAAARAGDLKKARRLHFRLAPLVRALFLESNPIPVKAALAELGVCRDEMRLPLVPMTKPARAKLRAALKAFRKK